jgi:hypothetical protein
MENVIGVKIIVNKLLYKPKEIVKLNKCFWEEQT